VAAIKNGANLVFGHAAGAPQAIEQALVGRKDKFINLEIAHMINLGGASYLVPGMEKHFHHNALFVGATSREAVENKSRRLHSVFFL